MLDYKAVGSNFKEPFLFTGRWAGQGAAVPTAVANTTRGTGPASGPSGSGGPLTLARSGVGALTLTLPNPIGVLQNVDFWVLSAANSKVVLVTPPTAGSNVITMQVAYSTNAAAVDVAAGEELDMEIWCAPTGSYGPVNG